MSENDTDHVPGAVELAAMGTVQRLQDDGLMTEVHQVHAAAIIAAARAVDEAEHDGGKVSYAASVLSKLLDEWVPKPAKGRVPSYMTGVAR